MKTAEELLRRFKLIEPRYYERMDGYAYIGDGEVIFRLTDGGKVIFDMLEEKSIYLPPRNGDSGYLQESEIQREFTRKLKKKLAVKGITQKKLAAMTGISELSICKYTKGKSVPGLCNLHKLVSALDCPVNELAYFDYLI